MSLQWEPEWIEEIIEEEGIRVKVLKDKKTNLYACPICGLGDHASYFFTVKDLILHIRAHTEGYQKHLVKPKSHYEFLHTRLEKRESIEVEEE